ncbi:phage tail tape measure protein [Enterococcus hulanensis]|uniref:phage tail tape measure protein n=1 Tax=Enterococcus hulanensis TaxID=2559929 RepID=UPI00288DCA02|nr:phage tail tape measure protein [Enterococcus hulanensis]MDT2660705.1 phage tail tape measure protein [Enterococcus hulanensis]
MVQNGKPLGNMIIRLGLDSSAFSDSLTGAQRATKTAVREMQAGFKVASGGATTLSSLATKQQGLTKVIQAQEKELGHLKTAYDKTLDSQGNATSKTAAAAQKYNEAQAKLATYKQEMINTAGAMADMKVRTEGVTGTINQVSQKLSSAGKVMSSAGAALTKGVTVPLVAGAAAVTKAAISWESDFAGVKKTNDEVVDSTGKVVYSYKDLEKGLRDLATELPASHKEIAGVAEAAGQLGIKTENVKSFTKTMIDLGESTNMSSEKAATSLARFANITGMSQKDFDKLGSVIVDLGNNFATTESEITDMGLRLAGAGKQVGMSQGDIMGLATALSSVGVEAEAGGSAFSKVMIQMQLAVEKGSGAFEDLRERAADAGISMEQLQAAIRNGGKDQKAVAEAMGMTSSELKKMYKEADKSKTSLENFSNVTGMTAEQFSKLFKSDPTKAITAFIQGLKDSEKHGTSAIKVLDDMDIKEVRLRDSLLRAANASGVFDDAIKMGNKAWKENTALTEEANKRYETTESKLKMLKNEAVNAAIDLGGPFVDALRSSLEAGKPLIKTLGELAQSFNEADPKTQKAIIKLIAFAAAAGPVLSVTGKLSSGIGMLGSSFVNLAAKIASKSAMAAMAAQLGVVGSSAATTTTSVGGLTTAVGGVTGAAATASGSAGLAGLATSAAALVGPIGIGVGALAVLSGAVYAVKTAYEEHQLAGGKWGVKITEEQDKVINKSHDMREKCISALNEYQDGVSTNATEIVNLNKKIEESIESTIKKEQERREKIKDSSYLSESTKQWYDQVLNAQKNVDKATMESVKETTGHINQIYKNASDNNRQLTAEEMSFIKNSYAQLSDDQLKAAGLSKTERIAIESAYQDDLSKLSKRQVADRIDTLEKSLTKEKLAYDKQREEIQNNDTLSTAVRKQLLSELEQGYKEKTGNMITALANLNEEQGNSIEKLKTKWRTYGYSVEEVSARVLRSTKDTNKNLDMFAKGTSEADMAWNELSLDPKTGEVKSNMSDVLVDIAKTDDGWNQLKFMTKEAKLSTNAKEEVAIAMGEAGKWDSLWLSEKELLLKGDKAKIALYDTINGLGKWNEYNTDRKELGIDSADAIWKLLDSEQKISQWNMLPIEQKNILANNTDLATKLLNSEMLWNNWLQMPESEKKILGNNQDLQNKVFESEQSYNAWSALPENVKHMLGNNEDLKSKIADGTLDLNTFNQILPQLKQLLGDSSNLQNATTQGENAINKYKANNAPDKHLKGNSTNVQNAATQGERSLNLYTKNNPAIKNLKGNPASVNSASSSGESSLNRYASNNPSAKSLVAYDNASYNAAAATNGVVGFARQRDHTVTLTTRIKRVFETIGEAFGFAKGTSYHRGGDMIVNDQKGSLYKELVVFPNGKRIIPEGRDILIPNAPRGTKVFTAAQTKRMIPHYAKGVGVPNDSSLAQFMNVNRYPSETKIELNQNSKNIEALLVNISRTLEKIIESPSVIVLESDMRELARGILPYQDKMRGFNEKMEAVVRGDS